MSTNNPIAVAKVLGQISLEPHVVAALSALSRRMVMTPYGRPAITDEEKTLRRMELSPMLATRAKGPAAQTAQDRSEGSIARCLDDLATCATAASAHWQAGDVEEALAALEDCAAASKQAKTALEDHDEAYSVSAPDSQPADSVGLTETAAATGGLRTKSSYGDKSSDDLADDLESAASECADGLRNGEHDTRVLHEVLQQIDDYAADDLASDDALSG